MNLYLRRDLIPSGSYLKVFLQMVVNSEEQSFVLVSNFGWLVGTYAAGTLHFLQAITFAATLVSLPGKVVR